MTLPKGQDTHPLWPNLNTFWVSGGFFKNIFWDIQLCLHINGQTCLLPINTINVDQQSDLL